MVFTQKNRPKTVVLGLDGLPYSLARKLGEQGTCPNIHSLIHSGNASPMHAELPELSPVNWTSFYTAAGPEEHGVFGFTRLNPNTYATEIADFNQVQAETIFDRLGGKGLYSKVINLPNTYPARPINGILVSGFVAPELEKAVYPPPLVNILRAKGYRLEADTVSGSRDHEFLLREISSTLDSRLMALDLLWPDMSWDLFVLVLTETDRLFHFLYPALEEETHPLNRDCLEFMKKWDRAVGEVLKRYRSLPDPKRLIVLADHGFTGLKQEADLNAWLKTEGFLNFESRPENELDARSISPETKAFCLDPGRIFIHDCARFARGRVQSADRLEIAREIKTGLYELTWKGERVISEIYPGSELYPGAQGPHVPDLVCVPAPGFELKGKFDRREIFGLFKRSGCHTDKDAFFFDSQGMRAARTRDAGQAVMDFFSSPKIIV